MLDEKDRLSLSKAIEGCGRFCGGLAEFCEFVDQYVRPLLTFRSAAIAVVSMAETELHISHMIGIDAPVSTLRAFRQAMLLLDQERSDKWSAAAPVVFNSCDSGGLFAHPDLESTANGYIALHRQTDMLASTRFYFGCVGITKSSAARVRLLLTHLTPHLYNLIAQLKHGELKLSRMFTPAEREVIAWLCSYKSNKEIARLLGKSVATVRNQLHAIFCKLGVQNRAAAIGFLDRMRK